MDAKYIDLTEAAERSPGRPHTASVWRWCRKGIKSRSGTRIYLSHIRAGGKIFIRESALDKFFVKVAEADQKHFDVKKSVPDKPSTSASRRRQIRKAERELERAGI